MHMRRLSEAVYIRQLISVGGALTDEADIPSGADASNKRIDVSNFERIGFLVQVGPIDQDITFAVQKSTVASGGAVVAVEGAQVTFPGATGDNKWALVELDTVKLGQDYPFVNIDLETNGATTPVGGILFLGWRSREWPPVYGTDLLTNGIVVIDG